MRFISLDCFDEFTSRFIQSRVNKLIGKCGIRESDRTDLIQTFVLDLWKRRPQFDSQLGTWEAFVVVVCENCFATILEHHCAAKRSTQFESGSLNQRSSDREGRSAELGDTLPESQTSRRTGYYPRDRTEAFELEDDVACILDSLAPESRHLCQLVMRGSITQVARELGVSRQTVYRRLNRLLSRFESAGLRKYLSK